MIQSRYFHHNVCMASRKEIGVRPIDLSSIDITPSSQSCTSLCKKFGINFNSENLSNDIENYARFLLLNKIEKSLYLKFNSNKKSAAEFDSSRLSGNGFSSIYIYIPALAERILENLLALDKTVDISLHYYSQSVALTVANEFFPRPKNISKNKIRVLFTPMGGN